MHVAAAAPRWISIEDVEETELERERAILTEQARESGKPEEIIGKMVDGRLRKYFEETVFLEDIDAGAVVEVMPIDYGFRPVRGKLLAARFDEIVVSRNDSDLGTVFVHFPRIGFQVRRVS